MSKRASDIAAQVAKMTSSVVQVPPISPSVAEADDAAARRRASSPRFTVIMPKEQHRFIMQFALDADTDASTVTRSLFSILQNDPSLARRLRQELGGVGERGW
jgi:hypothetical protein